MIFRNVVLFDDSYIYLHTGRYLLDGLIFFHLHPFLLETWAILLGQMLVIQTHPEGLHSKRNYRNLKHNSYSSKSDSLMRLSLHFHQSSIQIFTMVDSFEFKAAQQWQMRAVWVFEIRTPALLWEQMSLWETIDVFWVYKPTQMCYYSGLSSLLSICVGTQGQEIRSLFF